MIWTRWARGEEADPGAREGDAGRAGVEVGAPQPRGGRRGGGAASGADGRGGGVGSWFAYQAGEEAKAAPGSGGGRGPRGEGKKRKGGSAEARGAGRRPKPRRRRVARQKETERAESEKRRAEDQLRRAEWLGYAGKLSLVQSAVAENNRFLAVSYLDECQLDLRGWEHRHLRGRLAEHRGPRP